MEAEERMVLFVCPYNEQSVAEKQADHESVIEVGKQNSTQNAMDKKKYIFKSARPVNRALAQTFLSQPEFEFPRLLWDVLTTFYP